MCSLTIECVLLPGVAWIVGTDRMCALIECVFLQNVFSLQNVLIILPGVGIVGTQLVAQ